MLKYTLILISLAVAVIFNAKLVFAEGGEGEIVIPAKSSKVMDMSYSGGIEYGNCQISTSGNIDVRFYVVRSGRISNVINGEVVQSGGMAVITKELFSDMIFRSRSLTVITNESDDEISIVCNSMGQA